MQQLAEFGQCMVSLDSGARIQIATSAMGRAYLTAVSESDRNDIMTRVRELADAARWPELQRGVARALRDIRELGVCCSFGKWQKDVNAIALPVRAAAHRACQRIGNIAGHRRIVTAG